MPRRDGLPTNNELLEQFSKNGRDLFVAALERDFLPELPPSYIGKKLGHLVLTICIESEDDYDFPNAVEAEYLRMKIVEPQHADIYRTDHLTLKGTAVADAIAAESMYLSGIVLDDSFNPGIIGMRGVDSSYTATMVDTRRTRHVDSYKEKPSKQSIVSGIYCEEAALKYVMSEEFEDPVHIRRLRAAVLGSNDEYLAFSHNWSLPYRAGMVFNGYESPNYLNGYLEFAMFKIKNCEDRYQRLLELGAPESMLAHERELIEDFSLSITSAKSALENQ